MPDATEETSAESSKETSGLVDDLAAVLEGAGVHVEDLVEELLEAVELAEELAAALEAGAGGAEPVRATAAGLAAANAALRGAWDAVPELPLSPSWAREF